MFAVAPDFGSGDRDFDAAVFRDLLFQFFVERGFKFTHFAAFEAGDVNVVARAVAFVEVLVAAQVKQVQFIDQTAALEQIHRAIYRYAMHTRIDFLSAFEDGSYVEVGFGVVHHLD